MSTDFSLDALLNGSTSSTSVTSPNSNKQSPTSPSQLNPQKALPIAPAAPVSDIKRSKRKREDSDDEKENKNGGAEPVKKRRVRTAFTREQLQRLEFAFAQNQYPDMLIRENIAEELGLPNQKVHVWFQNRRAKQRRLTGQPTAVFPPPVVCPPFHPPPQATTTSLKLPQPSSTSPTVYLNHPPPLQQQSIGVQTQRFPLSPSPSPINFRVPQRKSLSSTPSVSPLSTPSGSPSLLKIVSPQQSGATAAMYPIPSCSFVLPARTSPPALHLPVSASQFSLGSGQPHASPFPYYCSPQSSSAVAPSAPMYFVDMTPPLSGNRVSPVIPPFPQVNIYQV